MEFRNLIASEIEIRVGLVKEGKGCTLLLYKDARCDMAILDETVGAENWQREHYECKGNLFCRVGIKVEKPEIYPDEWIWKSDCGAESNTEAEKGEASDSFKRACVNWGIGRELYTAPFIWVNSKGVTLNGKKTYDKFSVESITIENKKITQLSIRNDSLGFTVFDWEKGKSQPIQEPPAKSQEQPTQSQQSPQQVTTQTEKQTLVDAINNQIKKIHNITGMQPEFIKKTAQANTKCEGKTVEELRKINHYVAEWAKAAEQDNKS